MSKFFKKTRHYKKRISRNKTSFKKFYSVFRYDKTKLFHFLSYNKLRYQCHLYKTQWELLDICYLRDENENLCRDTDLKSIFRYKTLHKIYNCIYKYFETITDKKFLLDNGIVIWEEDKQAEILGTYNLPLKERLYCHIRLLRGLRQGKSLEEVMKNETL